jgi:hypothetical protein
MVARYVTTDWRSRVDEHRDEATHAHGAERPRGAQGRAAYRVLAEQATKARAGPSRTQANASLALSKVWKVGRTVDFRLNPKRLQ